MIAPGTFEEYDQALEQVNIIKQEFTEYLKLIRKRFNDNKIDYFHVQNFRYQLEFPEALVKGNKKP